MAQTIQTSLTDENNLIAGVLRKEEGAIRAIIGQHNQRLFRIARSILGDDGEAEDALQESYVRAFTKIGEFRQQSSLGTWLSRIVVNEALSRLRKLRSLPASMPLVTEPTGKIIPFPSTSKQPDPERTMAQNQIQTILERTIDTLPEALRMVLVARTVEEMSIEETAELFGLKPETVKTRLHRARILLQKRLEQEIGPALTETFPFAGSRCRKMADDVVKHLAVFI